MEKKNHFYIISYDLDKRSEPLKSKRLLEFLRKYHAVCLTKSTWLICTSSDCHTVFTHVSKVMAPYDDINQLILNGHIERDRLFVAEVTGDVFGEFLICDESGSNLSLNKLIELSKSDLIKDGFQSVYG